MNIIGSLLRRLGIRSTQPPLLAIPLSVETADDFFARVEAVMLDGRAHVYLDTSMLMWLTKVGGTARSQLLGWLEANCRGRLHVPVWAAHEYLRHYVAGTAKLNLAEAIKHLEKAAGVYASIHPYLDEQLGVESAPRQQSDARQVLARTAELAQALGKWGRLHQRHAVEVLEFINRCGIEGTNVFAAIDNIEAVGSARFAGRLPPGFKDKNKKEALERRARGKAETAGGTVTYADDGAEAETDEGSAVGVVGHNRWGDLIFWKEVLEHARGRHARGVVILTNDRKNDWYMGGGSTAGMSVEMQRYERLKPIPRPHPVLVAEARSAARIHDLVLLDSPYLALLMRRLEPTASDAIADVALIQRLAPVQPRTATDATTSTDGSAPPAPATSSTWRDPPGLAYSRSTLRDALTLSRAGPSGSAANLVSMADKALVKGDGVSVVLMEEHLAAADVQALVTFAREAGDRARQGEAGWVSAASDLASALITLPQKTAGCLYFGLLASAHFRRADNAVLLPPTAPHLNILWDLRGVQHFVPAVVTVRDRIERGDRRPIYLIGDAKPLSAVLEIDADGEVATDLRQLRLGGQLLLQAAQFRAELRLRERADGAETMTGEHIVRLACEVFGVPFDAVTANPDFGRNFSIRREIGFKDPAQIYITNPEAE